MDKRFFDLELSSLPFALSFLGVLLFALCVPVWAQQPAKIPRIGFFGVRPDATNYSAKYILIELQKLGYVEGKNFTFEYRSAENKIERLPGLIDQLLRLKIDVLITAATRELQAVQKATKELPVVSLNLGEPVGSGLIRSLAHPDGNITGFTVISIELTGKRLELLKETFPKISQVAVLVHPQTATPETWQEAWKEAQRIAPALGVEIRSVEINSGSELEGKFKEMIRLRTNGLVVSLSPLINSIQKQIAGLAATNRIPAIYPRGDFAESGGLMSYGADRVEPYQRVAVMVDKILKGTKPADIPVERPTKFEFVINLKTAKQIGLTIPPNVLARADKVIK
jgi:putative ABC transport system substrate-binding protein